MGTHGNLQELPMGIPIFQWPIHGGWITIKLSWPKNLLFIISMKAKNELYFGAENKKALMMPEEILSMPEDKQLLFVSGKNLKPILAEKHPYYARADFAGRFLPNPFHLPHDSVAVPSRWGERRARIIKERVPQQFSHLPQYSSGMWSYVEGFRPT